jgi:hypothetical protein
MVIKFYAKWDPGRQMRLTQILKEAFEDMPKPVSVEGGRR